MSDDIVLEVEKHQTSWMSGWFKWCPTSADMLREAEKKILSHLKTLSPGKYVNIGCIAGSETNHLWTLRANEDSPKMPVLLLHGFGSGSALWCLNIDSIAADRPVYAMDILGFGRSSRPKFDTNAIDAERQFITSIEEWRKEVGLEKFIIVGHSFGGFLAASYSIKNPQRVAHLVLADPWGFPERPLEVDVPLWARMSGSVLNYCNLLGPLRAAGPLGPSIIKIARPDMTRKFAAVLPEAAEIIPSYLYHCNAQTPSGETGFLNLMSGFGWAKHPIINRLDSLQSEVPITLVYGSRSWVDRDPGFHIQYSRPDSYVDVQILQGAGHHVYADRAERFNSIIKKLASFADEGRLPPAPKRVVQDRSEKVSPASTLRQFINVRLDSAPTRQSDLLDDPEEATNSGDPPQQGKD